MFFFVAIETGV